MSFREYLDSIEDIDGKLSTLLEAVKIEEQYIKAYFLLKAENDDLKKQLEIERSALANIGHKNNALDKAMTQVANLEEENQKLQANYERAKERYREAKRDAETAVIVARKKINKDTQEIRDRLMIISNMVMEKGGQEKASAIGKFSITELNNIIGSLEIIITKMSEVGIWDSDEDRPVLKEIVKAPKAEKKTRKKAKDNDTVNDAQMSLGGDNGELWN